MGSERLAQKATQPTFTPTLSSAGLLHAKPVVDPIEISDNGQQTLTLQAQLERASRLGHHFKNVQVSAPADIQRDSDPEVSSETIGTDLESSIRSTQGCGQPLERPIRRSMEHAFGADFGQVRIHTNAQADTLNRSIQAQAFTTGQDIFFRSNSYDPGSSSGKHLLAHELAHVIQQSSGQVSRPQTKLTIGEPGDQYEQEADAMAAQVVQRLDQPQNIQRDSQDMLAAKSDYIQRKGPSTAGATSGGATPTTGTGGGGNPARLHIHADIDTADFGVGSLLEGAVGHAWVSLEWKDPTAIPASIPANHQGFLTRGGMFADPMGFWPRMFGAYDPLLDEWSSLPSPGQEPPGYTGPTRVGYSSNPFKSYVPGQMVHPDNLHQGTVKATQTYDITEAEAESVITYAESKRDAQYSVFYYNCTTFAKEAVESAGKTPPSMTTGGIAYPNALYEGIKNNQENKKGHTTMHETGTTVIGDEEKTKKN